MDKNMKNKFKRYYDKESDSLWIVLDDVQEEYFEEIAPGIIIEFDKKSKPIGIEIINYQAKFTDSPNFSFSSLKKEIVYKPKLKAYDFLPENSYEANYNSDFSSDEPYEAEITGGMSL